MSLCTKCLQVQFASVCAPGALGFHITLLQVAHWVKVHLQTSYVKKVQLIHTHHKLTFKVSTQKTCHHQQMNVKTAF